MLVKNIGSNMTEIFLTKGSESASILVSYETPVAALVGGKFYKTRSYYSKTTTSHINKWLDGREAQERSQSFFNSLLSMSDNGGYTCPSIQAHEQVALSLEMLLIDLTDGYNTMPKDPHRQELIEDALVSLQNYKRSNGKKAIG